MAARPGDGPQEDAVVEKTTRIPLAKVAFSTLTFVPNFGMVSEAEVGATRIVGGKTVAFPQIWLDLTHRFVSIDGAEYPLERIHYWTRAKMALSKRPKPAEFNHRIGKPST